MHVLIVGTTCSGKTTLARKLAKEAYSKNRSVLVLDPLNDPDWQTVADFVTDDADLFLDLAKKNKDCNLIIDEAGESCGQHDKAMHWLATQSRHRGHQSIFISQRAVMVARTIRDNCDKLFCFRVSHDDAKMLYNDFCYPELRNTPELQKGMCYFIPRYGKLERLDVFA